MAQPDSASDSDSDGWRFESVWVRHSKCRGFTSAFFIITRTDSIPDADAIGAERNNRYYARRARYVSVWVHQDGPG